MFKATQAVIKIIKAAKLTQAERGFSLIEILICILIIGLLSSFGVPIYKKHVERAHLLEGLSLVNPIKLSIQEIGLNKGFNSIQNNASLGLPAPEALAGDSVSKITILSGGRVQVSYQKPEGSLTFTPIESFGILRWQCQADTESFNDILPPQCSAFKK